MSIKRYGLCSIGSGITTMMSDSDGKFVKHEDYAALEQQLAESQREFRSADATIENLQMQVEKLAAEGAATANRMQRLIQIISNADNDYCMCGDAMKNHTHGGCGHPTGMFDYHYNQWLEASNETPATDAFLAEVRASAVDSLIDIKTNQLARMHPDTHAFGATADFIRSQINELQSFAALLRKGVQS